MTVLRSVVGELPWWVHQGLAVSRSAAAEGAWSFRYPRLGRSAERRRVMALAAWLEDDSRNAVLIEALVDELEAMAEPMALAS